MSLFKVTYYSSCVGDGPIRQTNKCSGLRVGSRVQFTAKIEVVKCPKVMNGHSYSWRNQIN